MTAAAQLNSGSRIFAAAIRGVAPGAVIKGADETVTSSTTLQNDDALLLAVPANSAWFFVCSLDYEGGTLGASDLQWKWALPAGATMRYHRLGLDNTGASTVGALTTETGNPVAGTSGAGTLKGLTMVGTLAVSSTAGTMQLQWAQHTSSATATIVHAGSVLSAWQIA